jgi:hypothetical protein
VVPSRVASPERTLKFGTTFSHCFGEILSIAGSSSEPSRRTLSPI